MRENLTKVTKKKIDPTQSKEAGRPRNDIDWEAFENLCSIYCTQSEIASWFKVDTKTLVNAVKKKYETEEFSEVYKKFSETGKCSLRRYQFVQAKTRPNMAIWLGKQLLGQRDDPSFDLLIRAEEAIKQLAQKLEEMERIIKKSHTEPSPQ